MRLWCWCVVALAACTKPNPEVCCLDAADCASIGVSDPERTCAEGLACVNNACVVPSCSTDGCSAEAPVCDIALDVCTGCTGPADCDQFDTKVCDTGSGSCVECVEAADCGATTPVCDAQTCRGCQVDSECASGACSEDGACVAETDAVYVAPTGTDAGDCPRDAPCLKLQFALSKTSTTRNHIVMANGSYTYPGTVKVLTVTTQTTPAAKINVHGGGASIAISGADGQEMFELSLPTVLTDLTLGFATFGQAIVARAPTTLKRMSITAEVGIEVRSTVNAEDISISATNGNTRTSIRVESGSLVLKRGNLQGGKRGLVAVSGSIVELENVLVSDTTEVGVDLTANSSTTAMLSFVTITQTSTAATATSTGTAGLICPNNNTQVRSTIVWTPTNGTLVPISGCSLSSTIAGPTAVAGATNEDPRFVDFAMGDYHLSSNSPAKDLVDVGPALDFEGDPRPSGSRFDIGADEVRR